jgi:HK97 gp10 family phage protein
MSITLKVAKRNKKYRSADNQYNKLTQQVISIAGQMVRNTAVKSIQSSSGGGRTYGNHTASAEGQPPNTDTGFLASNIFAIYDADKLGCDIESRADYSEYLEFGTSKMKERPFMQPALEENRPKIKSMYRKLKARGA